MKKLVAEGPCGYSNDLLRMSQKALYAASWFHPRVSLEWTNSSEGETGLGFTIKKRPNGRSGGSLSMTNVQYSVPWSVQVKLHHLRPFLNVKTTVRHNWDKVLTGLEQILRIKWYLEYENN